MFACREMQHLLYTGIFTVPGYIVQYGSLSVYTSSCSDDYIYTEVSVVIFLLKSQWQDDFCVRGSRRENRYHTYSLKITRSNPEGVLFLSYHYGISFLFLVKIQTHENWKVQDKRKEIKWNQENHRLQSNSNLCT